MVLASVKQSSAKAQRRVARERSTASLARLRGDGAAVRSRGSGLDTPLAGGVSVARWEGWREEVLVNDAMEAGEPEIDLSFLDPDAEVPIGELSAEAYFAGCGCGCGCGCAGSAGSAGCTGSVGCSGCCTSGSLACCCCCCCCCFTGS